MRAVKHPAEAVWATHIKNLQATLPALLPNVYSSIEYLDGPPLAPGGLVRVNYNAQHFGHYDYLVAKWEEMDHDNHFFKMRIVEGGSIGKHFGTLIYTLKIVSGSEPNACIKKWGIEYDDIAKHQFHDILKEEISFVGSTIESHLSTKA